MTRQFRASGAVLGTAVLLAALAALPARAESLVEITVSGVRNARGVVRVALCTPADFLEKHCAHNAAVPARQGTVLVPFTDVPPGTYAAQAWHDENDSDQIDRNWLGIPREGVGFSNDPSLLLGPPSFRSAASTVGLDGGHTALRLRYFL